MVHIPGETVLRSLLDVSFKNGLNPARVAGALVAKALRENVEIFNPESVAEIAPPSKGKHSAAGDGPNAASDIDRLHQAGSRKLESQSTEDFIAAAIRENLDVEKGCDETARMPGEPKLHMCLEEQEIIALQVKINDMERELHCVDAMFRSLLNEMDDWAAERVSPSEEVGLQLTELWMKLAHAAKFEDLSNYWLELRKPKEGAVLPHRQGAASKQPLIQQVAA